MLLAYDREGRVREQQVTIEGLPVKADLYAYDLAGRLTNLTYPYSTQARYAYDSAGRLATVAGAGGNPFAAYTYTDAGNIATHTVGANQLTGAYDYTSRNWVQTIDYPDLFESTNTYDDVGNVSG